MTTPPPLNQHPANVTDGRSPSPDHRADFHGVSTPTRRRPNPLSRLVRVAETHVGRGVFARRRLAGGIVVGEIHGTVMDSHPEDSQYCMELQSGRLLEPTAPFRYLNHSCDPNCELFYWEDADPAQEDRLWLQTIRPIEAGEQLLIDYCWPADAAIPCQCGATNCRGWVVDPAELHLLTPSAAGPADGGAGPSRP